MEQKELLHRVDHTLLAQTATWSEIQQILMMTASRHGCASVCIPPSYVKQAAEYLQGRLPVCTVIGFPNGYNTTAVKCFEAETAVNEGAAEIDMVINLGWVEGSKVGRAAGRDQGSQGRLSRQAAQSHHRDLPAD